MKLTLFGLVVILAVAALLVFIATCWWEVRLKATDNW